MRGYVFPVIPEETISEKNFTRNLRSTFSINTFSEQKTIKFSESNWSSMTINLLFKRHLVGFLKGFSSHVILARAVFPSSKLSSRTNVP